MIAYRTSSQIAGFSMIEILVTLVILLFGLLGLAGTMMQSQRSEMESYQRVQALDLLQDMVGRIKANQKAASCYALTAVSSGTPYLGVGASAAPTCSAGTSAEQVRAEQDMNEWSALLQGAAETQGTSNVGAMIGARGCVSYDSTTLTYLVSVVWQGMGDTAAPSGGLNCGKDLYGNETRRRAVSMTLKIATLS